MKRSGSNITAKYTLEENKKLFCIPNSIEIKQAEGTNELIRKGGILTRDYIDILEEYIPNIYNKKIKKEKTSVKNKRKEIPQKYKTIYENIGQTPININELYRNLKIKNISYLNQILYIMELDNYIERLPGNNYIRKTNNEEI